jgi:mitochondrial fission protein ELM1
MSESGHKYSCWIIAEQGKEFKKIGRRNQCIGVAQAMGASIETLKTGEIEEAGGVGEFLRQKFGRAPRDSDWPDIILSSGPDAGNAAIKMKELSKDKVFIATTSTHVFAHYFDFMVESKFFTGRFADNNIEIIGVTHKVTPETISRGVNEWRDRICNIVDGKSMIISALIGGDINKGYQFSTEDAEALGRSINQEVKRLDASLFITNSPRMPAEMWPVLRNAAMEGIKNGYVHDCRSDKGNPFMAMLGVSNTILVTGDSFSMCCEAVSTGKPVYIACPPSISPTKYLQTHDELYKMGLAKKYEGSLEPFEVKPNVEFNETKRVADALSKILDKYLENQRANIRG